MNRYFNWRYWQTVFSESLIEGFPKYIFLTLRLSLLMLFYSLFRGLFYIYNADQFPDINPGGLLTIFIGYIHSQPRISALVSVLSNLLYSRQ